METVLTALSIISTLCAIIFGYLAFVRNRDKDKESNAKTDATVLTEIGYIKANTDEIKAEQKEQRKTNTEFVEVRDRQHVRMRVWERGAAVTLACGTGSCATAVAGVLTGRTDRKVEVELDGGKLTVEWDEATNHVFMTGPAELVFTGEIAD